MDGPGSVPGPMPSFPPPPNAPSTFGATSGTSRDAARISIHPNGTPSDATRTPHGTARTSHDATAGPRDDYNGADARPSRSVGLDALGNKQQAWPTGCKVHGGVRAPRVHDAPEASEGQRSRHRRQAAYSGGCRALGFAGSQEIAFRYGQSRRVSPMAAVAAGWRTVRKTPSFLSVSSLSVSPDAIVRIALEAERTLERSDLLHSHT